MKNLIPALAFLILVSCNRSDQIPFQIIPEPQSIEMKPGFLVLSDTLGHIDSQVWDGLLDAGDEAYELEINPEGIFIRANTAAGAFWARQTVEQILPPGGIRGEIRIPCANIQDEPLFSWRGGMLDVSRHFMPTEFIYKYLDILAFHKLNHFHWHLTDGTAWRLQINKYPELTEGVEFYSQEEVRSIVEYAKAHFITIIPEIEMPGHSDAVLERLPHLKCDSAVPSGVFCAGKEVTFKFLEEVLTEVVDLFPSEIIHVGGDEVGKSQWKLCPECQNRMKQEGLQDENELQSYFVKRVESILASRGRHLIGWDEILEGGLAESALVMSWRGMKGGIEAANAGHDVVMSPGYPCYFDHYQSSNYNEPQAWGGLNRLLDVYAFNPIPSDIDPDKAGHILGAQANLWTEKVASPVHAEYMMMPRYSALSEALWSGPEKKNLANFKKKMVRQLERYEAKKYNYSGSAFTPEPQLKLENGGASLRIALHQEMDYFPIHYELGGDPVSEKSPVYNKPIRIGSGQILRAQTFRNGAALGWPVQIEDLPNKASKKRVEYLSSWESDYSGRGAGALTDAQLASKRGDHPCWQGFRKKDFEVLVDLGQPDSVQQVWIRFFQHIGMTSVLFPKSVAVSGSLDGESFSQIAETTINPVFDQEALILKVCLDFESRSLRYLKITANNPGILFNGHPRQGGDSWIFADELGIK